MENIIDYPESDEQKAKINALFRKGWISYDLGAGKLEWVEQRIFKGQQDWEIN